MAKFNFTAYRQLSPPKDVARGIWSIEPLNPIGCVQIICDFVDFQEKLRQFAQVNADQLGAQVIATGDKAHDQRAPNGWKQFCAERRDRVIVNPGEAA